MPRVLLSDHEFPDLALEKALFARAGIELAVAQCRTEDDVIREARDAFGILLQYAPITERVVAALPGARHRVAASAPASTPSTRRPASAMACGWPIRRITASARWPPMRWRWHLALVRNVVAYQRDIEAGQLALPVVGAGAARIRHDARHRRPGPHRQAHGAHLAQRVPPRDRRPIPISSTAIFRRTSSARALPTCSPRPTSSRCTRRSTTRRAA